MARPQNSEKLFSISENPSICAVELHQAGLKAAFTRSSYLPLRPRLSVRYGLKTLSLKSVFWVESGCIFSNLRPSFGNVRPSHDISNADSGGPTACDARLELNSATVTAAGVPLACSLKMRLVWSRFPKGFMPLKTLLARPSQKFRK